MSKPERRQTSHSRPICPQCDTEMWLMMATSLGPQQPDRSFRCPNCRTSITLPRERAHKLVKL